MILRKLQIRANVHALILPTQYSYQQPLQHPQPIEAAASTASDKLLAKLQLHQYELELQNAELQQVRAELERERTRYVNLYDLAPVAYCTVSAAGLILQANQNTARLLGVPQVELLAQPLSVFMDRDGGDLFYLLVRRLLTTGQAKLNDLPMFRPDGTQLLVHLAASTVQDADGNTLVLVALSDITAWQQLAALRTKNELAEAAAKAKFDFLAAASHDLRQPTHAMGLFVARLAALHHPAETLQLVNYLSQAVADFQGALCTLFEASQSEAAPPPGGGMVAQAQTLAAQTPAAGAALDDALAGLRLLVIEDDALGRAALTTVLASWGCDVCVADGPQAAFEQLQLGLLPDVIVSDYRLRDDHNGIDTIRSLRALAAHKIDAFLISADADASLRQQAQDAGLVLLQKPVRPAKLRSLLRHFQQGLAKKTPEVSLYGDV